MGEDPDDIIGINQKKLQVAKKELLILPTEIPLPEKSIPEFGRPGGGLEDVVPLDVDSY